MRGGGRTVILNGKLCWEGRRNTPDIGQTKGCKDSVVWESTPGKYSPNRLCARMFTTVFGMLHLRASATSGRWHTLPSPKPVYPKLLDYLTTFPPSGLNLNGTSSARSSLIMLCKVIPYHFLLQYSFHSTFYLLILVYLLSFSPLKI